MSNEVSHDVRYDAIVIGVGGMGSATVYQLARRGLRVIGLEQHDIAHDRGSSHGVNRIIRLAYWEHPAYVPLLRRAYELWRELETGRGEQLLYTTGSLDAGRADSKTVVGSLRSCDIHELPHELLSAEDVKRRFPGYRLPPEMMAVFQPEGGFVLCERAIVNYVEAAIDLGAEITSRAASDVVGAASRAFVLSTRCVSSLQPRRSPRAFLWVSDLRASWIQNREVSPPPRGRRSGSNGSRLSPGG